MVTTASAYLAALQRHEELYDWIASIIPADAGGSDLVKVPDWLQEQLRNVGIAAQPNFVAAFRLLLSKHDIAKLRYESVIHKLPDELQKLLQVGERLAVGTLNSCEFNGAVISVPDSNNCGRVIAFPIGGLHLLSFCGDLLGIHLTDRSASTMTEGYFHSVSYKQSLSDRWRRTKAHIRNRVAIQRKWTIDAVGLQFTMQIHRYAALGVIDINDYIREWLPIPVFPNPDRFGHPLELGACIANFAIDFFVLHECAHVIMQEKGTEPISPLEREFAADQLALSLSVSINKTEDARVAACAGAQVFLLIARWVENVDKYAGQSTTHPPAAARIKNLRDLMSQQGFLDRTSFAKVERVCDEFESIVGRIWDASSYLRSIQGGGMNSLRGTMRLALDRKSPSIFLDQIPRWLMFGAPQKLCRELAALRCELEHEVSTESHSQEARTKLEIVLSVYQVAEERPNSGLIDELLHAYRTELNRTGRNNDI